VTITFEQAFAAHQAGDFATAELGYRGFATTQAFHNLGTVYKQTDRLAEAEAVFRKLLAQRPGFVGSQHSLSMVLLAQRRYAEAWPLYEARRAVLNMADPLCDYPEWRGEPLAGKHMVLVGEQGLGDHLMFARWIPALRAQGARITVACDPTSLGRVYEACGAAVHPRTRASQRLPDADVWAFIGSLPLKLGAVPPAAAAYLDLPRRGGAGVGVFTHGNPANTVDRFRSLDEASAAALLALGRDLAPAATGARDLMDTAEIIAGLDLVITVETSVANLAGSLGAPCWVLLPRVAMDWRWNDGCHSDWYPDAKLYRQETAGDWGPVLDAVRRDLADLGRGPQPAGGHMNNP